MDTVQGGLTGGMVYSTVGDPTEIHKNPACETTQMRERVTEENVYDYTPSSANLGEDQSTGVQEESTNL